MVHKMFYNDDQSVSGYCCIVEDRSELLSSCYVAHNHSKQITKFGATPIPCFIFIDDHLKIRIESLNFPTQIYSKALRAIRIEEDGVSLNKLSYSDLN